MGRVLGGEWRTERDYAVGQLLIDQGFAERRPPWPTGPDADAARPGLVVGACQDDRRRANLARETPARGRYGSREGESGVGDEQAEDRRSGQADRTRHCRGADQKGVDEPAEKSRIRRVESAGNGRLAGRPAHAVAPVPLTTGPQLRPVSERPIPARVWPQCAHRPSTSDALLVAP